jgi:hypothetical protein
MSSFGIAIPEIENEAARRSVSSEDLCREALTFWFPTSDVASDSEFQEQLRIAREAMRRYRDTAYGLPAYVHIPGPKRR